MKGIRLSRSGSRAVLGVSALVAVILVFAAGCGDGGATTTTASTAAPGSTTTASVPTGSSDTTAVTAEVTTTTGGIVISIPTTESTTTTTEALSSAEKKLANGHIKAMGYIDKVYIQDGKRYISIDYAEILGGQAAIDAAIAAGYIEPGEDLPNDYWISNANPQKRVFEVSGTAAITTSTRWVSGDDMGAACTWNDFKSFWGPAGSLDDSEKHLKSMPWWIERNGQIVLKIDEQYLP
jgi:hypothetical protein